MFDFDSLREILATISKNKLRTSLTGFSVAWGIFMLIILLGSGNGLRNGLKANFANRAQNTVTLWPGYTSMPYKGLASNREIKFDEKDYELIKNKIPEVEYISAQLSQSAILSYEKEYGSYSLDGVSQDAQYISNIKVSAGNGRFINELDVKNKRKVIVINADIKKVLFKNENPLGKYIIADKIVYKVIGVYEKDDQFSNNPPAYIPFTTAQMLYNKGYGFRSLDFTVVGLKTVEQNEKFIKRLRKQLAALHTYSPDDRSAISVHNTAENVAETESIFLVITLFILVIGSASLMAGVVGVGNIMLITVKERTKEIGIRKAIGASPVSVVKLVVYESILITTLAGYIGLVLGIGITELVSKYIANQPIDGPTIFKDPTVDLGTVAIATLLLIIAGVVAGLIPSIKAARIRPIEAMNAE